MAGWRGRIILSASLLALAACTADPKPVPIAVTAPLDTGLMAYAKAPGTGRVEGEAFMRQRGGDVVTAAGSTVYLIPVTPYTTKLVAEMQKETNIFGPIKDYSRIDPALAEYAKETTAGATGAFAFDGVPPGDFYVLTYVTWKIPDQYVPEGGGVAAKVTVAKGQTVRAIVTR